MSRGTVRIPVLAWVAGAVLLYVLFAPPLDVVAEASIRQSPAVLLSAFGAVCLLVGAWAWLLARSTAMPEKAKRRHRVRAALVLVIVASLAAIPDIWSLVFPALVVMIPVTLSGIGAWRWLAALFLVPALFNGFYFGVLLIVVGLLRMPRRAGDYLRELFPRRVGGAT